MCRSPDFSARYLFLLTDKKKPLFIEVSRENLTIRYGQEENIDIYAKLSQEVMEAIISGRMTFQRAFMTGEMTAKGNFRPCGCWTHSLTLAKRQTDGERTTVTRSRFAVQCAVMCFDDLSGDDKSESAANGF